MKGHKGHHHGHHGHHKGHHHHAGGGRIGLKAEGNPDVFKEAEGKESYAKHGGHVHKKHGHKHRKHGGHVHHEEHHHDGHHAHHRPDHKPRGRKRGGAVGADRAPLSSAHRGHKDDAKGSSSPHDTYGGTPP